LADDGSAQRPVRVRPVKDELNNEIKGIRDELTTDLRRMETKIDSKT
jgi:hypothetical protein